MIPLDRSYSRESREQVACLGLAAGLHVMVLLWNPTLIRSALQTLLPAPKEKPPITIFTFSDVPVPPVTAAPRRLPAPAPVVPLPLALPVAPSVAPPPARPPLMNRPIRRLPIGIPPESSSLETLRFPGAIPLAPVREPAAEKLTLAAPALVEAHQTRSPLGGQGVIPDARRAPESIWSLPLIAPTAARDDAAPLKPRRSAEAKVPTIEDGPLAQRQVLRRVLPEYPSWAEEQGAIGVVRLRFKVTREGVVRAGIEILRTSGYDALDRVAIDALRQWLFSPDPSALDDSRQWGIITFNFSLQREP